MLSWKFLTFLLSKRKFQVLVYNQVESLLLEQPAFSLVSKSLCSVLYLKVFMKSHFWILQEAKLSQLSIQVSTLLNYTCGEL